MKLLDRLLHRYCREPIPVPGDRADWEAMMTVGSIVVSICERCETTCVRKPSRVWTHADAHQDGHLVLLAAGVDDAWNDRPGVRASAAPPF